MTQKRINIAFPYRGLHRGSAYSEQKRGTSPEMLNVRPEGTLEGRIRGGQRPGLARLYDQQLGKAGGNPIRLLSALTVTQESGQYNGTDRDDFRLTEARETERKVVRGDWERVLWQTKWSSQYMEGNRWKLRGTPWLGRGMMGTAYHPRMATRKKLELDKNHKYSVEAQFLRTGSIVWAKVREGFLFLRMDDVEPNWQDEGVRLKLHYTKNDPPVQTYTVQGKDDAAGEIYLAGDQTDYWTMMPEHWPPRRFTVSTSAGVWAWQERGVRYEPDNDRTVIEASHKVDAISAGDTLTYDPPAVVEAYVQVVSMLDGLVQSKVTYGPQVVKWDAPDTLRMEVSGDNADLFLNGQKLNGSTIGLPTSQTGLRVGAGVLGHTPEEGFSGIDRWRVYGTKTPGHMTTRRTGLVASAAQRLYLESEDGILQEDTEERGRLPDVPMDDAELNERLFLAIPAVSKYSGQDGMLGGPPIIPHVTLARHQLTVDAITQAQETYIYSDEGQGNLGEVGDEYELSVVPHEFDSRANLTVFGLCNYDLNDALHNPWWYWNHYAHADTVFLFLSHNWEGEYGPRRWVLICTNKGNRNGAWSDLEKWQSGLQYDINVSRTDSETIKAEIYQGGTLVEQLSVSSPGTRTFQFLYGLGTFDWNQAQVTASADISNLDRWCDIVDADAVNDEFTCEGDATDDFVVGDTFKVKDSSANDGTYTVNSVNTDPNGSVIGVTEPVPDGSDDTGVLQVRQDYENFDAQETEHNVLSAPSVSSWSDVEPGLDGVEILETADDGPAEGLYQIRDVDGSDLLLEGSALTDGACSYRVGRQPMFYDNLNGLTVLHPTAGSVPLGCQVCCAYRGRLVYARTELQPHNWWMSRQQDSFDWDSTESDQQAAVSGDNANAGKVGDVIVSLMPFSDDYLLFGCRNSIWLLRGDPMAGGQLDVVSYQAGVVGPYAWCHGPTGRIFALSQDGLYRLEVSATGVANLSRTALPQALTGLRQSDDIHLVWDKDHQGVIISLPSSDSRGSETYFFDVRLKAFFRGRLPPECSPTAVMGTAPVERVTHVIGGRDGHLRYYTDRAETDDGYIIPSYVVFRPIRPGNTPLREGVLTHLDAVLGENSGAVQWEVRSGDNAQGAVQGRIRQQGIWRGGGRQHTARPRVRGGAIAIVLRSDEPESWVLESLAGITKPTGRQRPRR